MMKLTVVLFALIVLACSVQGEGEVLENTGLENCKCLTTYEYLPICANNGVTYSNKMMLECARKCLKRDDIRKAHDGRC